jgi:flagellar assembly factor FliW
MTRIVSRYFGSFDLHDKDLVYFPYGLPGFEDQTQYAALSIPGQEPILYLQSVARPELCLLTLPARVFCPDYQLELSPEDRLVLGLPERSNPRIGVDVACQVIVTVDQDREPAANLAAPLLINLSSRRALQIFQVHFGYSFQHPVASVLQAAPC